MMTKLSKDFDADLDFDKQKQDYDRLKHRLLVMMVAAFVKIYSGV